MSKKKVFTLPGGEIFEEYFSNSLDSRYSEIGQNRFIIPASWDIFGQLMDHVFSINDVVYLMTGLTSIEREMGYWYRSDEPIL